MIAPVPVKVSWRIWMNKIHKLNRKRVYNASFACDGGLLIMIMPFQLAPNTHVYGVVFHSTAKLWASICSIDYVVLTLRHWVHWQWVTECCDKGSSKAAYIPLKWRHNEHDGVSNHQRHECLLNRFFQAQIKKKHQSSASLAFARRIHRGNVNSPHKGPVTRKMFPFNDVIMPQYHLAHYIP